MADEETTLLAAAESFYEGNAKLCDDLVAELASAGAPLLEGNGIEQGTRIVRGAMPAAAPRA